MSHNSTAKVDQKEYLKKYLSGDKSKKKKKKKEKDKDKQHKRNSDGRIRIIDDDAAAFQGDFHSDEETFLYGEDAPQIVGEYIETKSNGDVASKWRSIAGEEKVQVKREQEEEDRWGKKVKDEYQSRVKREATPDMSPPRKNARKLSIDSEKPNRWSKEPKRREDTSDQSPPRQRKQKMHESVSNGARRELSSGRRQLSIDQSPPRQRRNNQFSRRHDGFDDQSPSRCRNLGQSPPRHQDIDQSPPRRHRESLDQSPRRRGQFSSPKHTKNRFSPNQSPVRKRHVSSDFSATRQDTYSPQFRGNDRRTPPDLSPPRRRRSCTPPNRGRQNFQNSKPWGFSPLRQNEYVRPERPVANRYRQRSRSFDRTRNNNTWNLNEPRRENPSNPFAQKRISSRNASSPMERRNMSPPRRRNDFFRKHSQSRESFRNNAGSGKRGSSMTRSPSSRRGTSDQSPQRPRQSSPKQEKRWVSPSPAHSNHSNRSQVAPKKATIHWETAAMVAERKAHQTLRHASESPPPTHKPKATKTLDGKKAGLQDARALKEETAARRHDEEKMYAKMSSELSGRDAEVQVRSTGRRGRRAREAKEEDPEKRRRKEEREQERKEQYDRWGKGLKQIEDHRARLAEQEYESSKPLARYADDEDLDRHLREQERAEDPMLEYMRRKRKDKEKKSGSSAKAPVYEGSYPENRFGIRPGYRWDGVDRSNGYEKKWFDVQNEKRAVQDDAYKYSVEDM